MSTDTTAFSSDALPGVVKSYLEAHVAEDYATAVTYLAEDVTVLDDGRTLHGREETRALFDATAEQFTVTTTLLTLSHRVTDVWEVGTHLSGDFPGGEVDLRMIFTLEDDVIRRLEITV